MPRCLVSASPSASQVSRCLRSASECLSTSRVPRCLRSASAVPQCPRSASVPQECLSTSGVPQRVLQERLAVPHWCLSASKELWERRFRRTTSLRMIESDTLREGDPTHIVSTLRGQHTANGVGQSTPSSADQSGQRSASSSATPGEGLSTDPTHAGNACSMAVRD